MGVCGPRALSAKPTPPTGPLPHPLLGTVLDTAAAGVPLRTLQERMGHRDYKTTLTYADYAPRTHEKSLMERAFSPAPQRFPEDT